ncbi:MAG: cell division protein SepF [Bifidobacteriaceae bacterium]|jgi:cell division inhibitor SepF|nr:cell division protein SepF [Bifidobacteriaceae bacterium]
MPSTARKVAERLGLVSAVPAEEYDYYYDEQPEEVSADVVPIHGGNMRVGAMQAADQMQRIVTARPRSYNEAKTVGSPYREGVPVIMNLTEASDADSQRLVDFAGGLTYALHGRLERITSRVFLLSPAAYEVSEVSGDFHRRSFDGE